jgi:hypothetical protein
MPFRVLSATSVIAAMPATAFNDRQIRRTNKKWAEAHLHLKQLEV